VGGRQYVPGIQLRQNPVLLSFEEFSVHSSFQYVTESGFICYLLLRPRTGVKQGWKIKKKFFFGFRFLKVFLGF